MKKSERLRVIGEFIERELQAGLNNSFPRAYATDNTRDLPLDMDVEERLDIWDKYIAEGKTRVHSLNAGDALKEYMEMEEEFTFYLNWTDERCYKGKDAVNSPFIEFMVVMQNLGYFEDYYVAFKIPKYGKVKKNEKLNIRVDVLARH